MKNKTDNPKEKFFSKGENDRWHIWVLVFVILAAFFVRSYNFSEWLVFKHDQARDARYAKEAFDEGIGHLRMLGPKGDVIRLEGELGRGKTLNLGPAYYYMQYASAVLMGRTDPEVFAFADLIFSILSIPIFYLILRKFFSKKISLLSVALYSFSFILTQYTRMAYNPNQLFFWQLLFVLSLLETSFNQDRKKAGLWLLAIAFSYGIISQVHFTAFFGFPLVIILFWVIYRPKNINWKYWAGAVVILLMMYLPLIVADVKNKGDNFQRFVVALSREREDSGMSLCEKIRENFSHQGEFFALALTSFRDKEIGGIERVGLWFWIISLGTVLVVMFGKRVDFLRILFRKISITEEDLKRIRPLLLLFLLWLVVFWLIYFKIVGRLDRPRYFLPIAPLPFVILALWFWFLEKVMKGKLSQWIGFFVFLCLLLGNVYGIFYWYKSMSLGRGIEMPYRDPQLRRHGDLITLGQMKKSIRYMVLKSDDRKNICLNFEDYQYKNAYKYLFSQYYPDYQIKIFQEDKPYEDCHFFVLDKDKDWKGDLKEEFLENFDLVSKVRSGAILIFEVKPKKNVQQIPFDLGAGDTEDRATEWRDLWMK